VYRTRMEEFSRTVFQPDRFHRQVDEVAAAIRSAVREESSDKLARFERVVAGEAVEPGGFGGNPAGGNQPGNRSGGPRPGGFGGFGGFMQPAKPIKVFADVRTASVIDQLAGKSNGEMVSGFGPGGPGGPGGGRIQGGPGGPGAPAGAGPGGAPGGPGGPGGFGGPGGPGGFGPGMFLGPVFIKALDTDKDKEVTASEFNAVFDQWFRSWSGDGGRFLSEEQLRTGIDKDLSPFRGGFPGGPGFGPPPGMP
jgi:hypothetical protein